MLVATGFVVFETAACLLAFPRAPMAAAFVVSFPLVKRYDYLDAPAKFPASVRYYDQQVVVVAASTWQGDSSAQHRRVMNWAPVLAVAVAFDPGPASLALAIVAGSLVDPSLRHHLLLVLRHVVAEYDDPATAVVALVVVVFVLEPESLAFLVAAGGAFAARVVVRVGSLPWCSQQVASAAVVVAIAAASATVVAAAAAEAAEPARFAWRCYYCWEGAPAHPPWQRMAVPKAFAVAGTFLSFPFASRISHCYPNWLPC